MPTLAETLAQALTQKASQRGRDWLASIPQAVQAVGPADTHPVGSAAQGFNQSYGDLLGSQIVPPGSGLSFVGTPSADQQRQWMAQLEMQKELGRLQAQAAAEPAPAPSGLFPLPGKY